MLRSAAAACDGRVLVAMLTGMGHDGLAGTKKVIEAGGAAIGQDEATSVVWGMPGAIAQAGLCHAVLPLPKIAPKLLEMLKGARRMTAPLSPLAFETLASLLKTKSGLIIGKDKLYLLETRLADIVKREKLADLNGLAERLRRPGSDALARDVVEAMTTNESFFFRDDKPFQHFRTQALPRLVAARPPGSTMRIWSAASSSGQEAYSLAMIVAECQRSARRPQGRDHRHRHRPRSARPRARGRLLAVRGAARPAGADADALFQEGGHQLADRRRDPRHGAVPRVQPAVRPAPAWPVRHRVLPQRADLFRSADQGAGAGGDRRR